MERQPNQRPGRESPNLRVIDRFVEVEKANHSIGTLFRVLEVFKSDYYDGRRSRPPFARSKANTVLTERIHMDSRETYGAPRIHAELRVLGIK